VLGNAPDDEVPAALPGSANGDAPFEAVVAQLASGAAGTRAGEIDTSEAEAPTPQHAPAWRKPQPADASANGTADHHYDYSASGQDPREATRAHDETTRLGRLLRPDGPAHPGPDRREERSGLLPEPEPSQTDGVSAAGLPIRRKQAAAGQRPVPTWGENGDGAAASPATTTARPRSSPRRRDSQQISDVLTAYSQGINRSASRRERSAPSNHHGSKNGNADDTQRNK
jgi:hypothetical protein